MPRIFLQLPALTSITVRILYKVNVLQQMFVFALWDIQVIKGVGLDTQEKVEFWVFWWYWAFK